MAVSVTGVFLQDRFVSSLSNPQRGRPVDHALSGPYPLTCLAWVAAPGNKSPASIALGVTETCQPTDCESWRSSNFWLAYEKKIYRIIQTNTALSHACMAFSVHEVVGVACQLGSWFVNYANDKRCEQLRKL